MNTTELLYSAAKELKSYIDKENERLKAGITSTDLEPPTYHDYQTCHELMCLGKVKSIKLTDYIKENHNGNLSEFGRFYGAKCDKVGKWVKAGYLFIDGKLYSPVKKRVKGVK